MILASTHRNGGAKKVPQRNCFGKWPLYGKDEPLIYSFIIMLRKKTVPPDKKEPFSKMEPSRSRFSEKGAALK